ncbi:MAG: bifunctional 4-hydroxy-2-oxoglutarate aldolase/2-dehydro-3-deoxy-phosphogluconate aldolase, partial [Pseudomonadota bacterium]
TSSSLRWLWLLLATAAVRGLRTLRSTDRWPPATPDDVKAAVDAGAQFGVSPGATDQLIAACEAHGLPLLPGAATASEAMSLLARGYDMLKFFPAEASGSAPALKAIGAPLPQISFCPTGGVSPANAMSYLSLPNVVCAGGSWVAPSDKVAANDWAGIETLARAASTLRP